MQSYSHTTKEFLVQQSKRTFTITIIISSLLMFVSCSLFTPKAKGKVIILSGQSNATGNAWNMYLSEEEQQKYSRGFDNIYINGVEYKNAQSELVRYIPPSPMKGSGLCEGNDYIV